jgi:hypothetical protein
MNAVQSLAVRINGTCKCIGRLPLSECGLHIGVCRPDIVRNLIAFGADFRFGPLIRACATRLSPRATLPL